MHALIVENSHFSQQFYATLAQQQGADTTIAESGAEALQRLRDEEFDLVCFALHLSDMSGLDFCRQARSLPSARHVPLVLLTATENEETYSAGLKSGITEIFCKSAPESFAAYVRESIRQARTAPLSGRALVVEDSKDVRAVIISLMGELGLAADGFPRAEDALAMLSQRDYDLIITDIVLEGRMNGMALVREIRNLPGNKQRIPILAVSGLDDETRRIELLKSGANDFIAKPIIGEELTARAKNLIIAKQLLERVEAQQARLLEMAMTDQLTRLYNRHFLSDVIPKKIAEARRHAFPLALLLLDLDHFKKVNDKFGHMRGDMVLKDTAKAIKSACRMEDIAARIGGEEFVVILPHCDRDNARVKAEILRATIETLRPGGIPVTASIGVASLRAREDCTFDTLLAAADKAVYAAKDGGRNRVETVPVGL